MFNSSEEWIAYVQTVHPRGMDLGLARITSVADHLNLRHFDIPVITVAGTNGKGSTCAMLSAIYLANGYRVASYTSPHLLEFNERFQINGLPITESQLVQAFCAVEQGRVATGLTLTYFEYAVLVALYTFHQLPLDVIILEVGLGGRKDATNIVSADCAVITNIDFDHEAILGNTREAIGSEKAGIIRDNKPVIFGDVRPVQSIHARAEALNAPLYVIGRDFDYRADANTWQFHSGQLRYTDLPIPNLPLVNACIALQTVTVMQRQLPIQVATLEKVFATVHLNGRWQHIPNAHCDIRVDVAHNPQSVTYLAQLIKRHPIAGRTLAVCSILLDKNQREMIQACQSGFSAWYIAPLDVPRGTPLEAFAEEFTALEVENVQTFPSIRAALTQALQDAQPIDRIICFGSFYTVAESLKTLHNP